MSSYKNVSKWVVVCNLFPEEYSIFSKRSCSKVVTMLSIYLLYILIKKALINS